MRDEKRDDGSTSHKHRTTLKHRASLKRSPSPTRASSGEFDLINRIKARAIKSLSTEKSFDSSHITRHTLLIKAIGDDAAVIRQNASRELVITTDLLVEDVDFRRAWMMPRLLGHKALAVSLSDIAAMGARARYALLSVGLPREIWKTDFVDEFYEGFFALAAEHGVALIGGDVSRTPEHIVIDSIVVGEVKAGGAVLRAGARAGDHIFVTGSLGGAAAGLRLLEQGARLTNRKTRSRRASAVEKLLARQLRPEPRMMWGARLGEKRLATAMIDVSDGLSSDLAHLCEESRLGAQIDAARIPVDASLTQLRAPDFDSLSLALDGGEDFELLFTISPRNLKRLPAALDGVPVTYLGDMTGSLHGIKLISGDRSTSLRPAGFSHF
jgi:thiamine-monophosphate kinase